MVAVNLGFLHSTVLKRVQSSHSSQPDAGLTNAGVANAGITDAGKSSTESQQSSSSTRDAHRERLANLAQKASLSTNLATNLAGNSGNQAFDDLATYLRPAFAAFFRDKCKGKHDLIEDLSQKSLVGLWQALSRGRYDPQRSAITTFAYAIGHKVWLQHLRATGRRDAAIDRYTRLVAQAQPRSTAADRKSLGEEAAHASLLEATRAVLSESSQTPVLSDDERWLLRAWAGGQSDRDLAKAMGIAASNVNVRKQRAYAKLREYLNKVGLTNAEPIP